MKRILAFLLSVLLIFSCACGEGTDNTEAGDESAAEGAAFDPNAIIDSIDETTPMGGRYQVHSKVGIQQMAEHPDAKFTVLRNIDLEGAELTPIENFTGTIDGANYVISNFTITAPDSNGNQGFIGTNNGEIKNLVFDNFTITTTEATKNAGTFTGVNNGTISRSSATGTLTADALAADAACGAISGRNSGSITNAISNVDLTVNASSAATVGGVAGISEKGTCSNDEQNGIIKVSDATGKTAGLIIGSATGTEVKACAFVGAENTLGGELFTDTVGVNNNSTVTKCLTRDNGRAPLPANVQALRDRVVDEMYAMGSVVWRVKDKLYHDCTCTLTVCHGAYYPEYTYVGIPYGHKGSTLARFNEMVDENNVIIDWAYDQESLDRVDCYTQSDCSSSLFAAWCTVSNSIDFHRVSGQVPTMNLGCYAVGDYPYDIINYPDRLSVEWIGDVVDEETMLEAYAQMRKGDAYWYHIEAGGHTRMAAEDPVVVRDENGKIDAQYSYVLCHEQGATHNEEDVYSTWKTNWKYTFASLLSIGCFPVTCEELMTGEMETPEAHFEGGRDDKFGLITGKVKANYYLDYVNMTITNADGEEVFDKNIYPALGRVHDGSDGGGGADTVIRGYHDELDMGEFAIPLQKLGMEIGGTYHCTITASLATGDSFMVKEFSFVNGTKTASNK